MESLAPKNKALGRFDKPFKNVETEYIEVHKKETDPMICAVVKALLEIDEILIKQESEKEVLQEAS